MSIPSKTYLGDSVYADFDGRDVVLTTECDVGPFNKIVLEPEVVEALSLFIRHVKVAYLAIEAGEEP